MTPLRRASILVAAMAILVALLAPWTHKIIEPLCIFPPCSPPHDELVAGYDSGGVVTAGILLAGALVLWFVPSVAWGLGIGGLMLAIAAALGFAHPLWPNYVIFGHEGGPAWGSVTTAGLALLALALVAADGARTARRARTGAGATE